MNTKGFAVTLGLGIITGAATAMLLPKNSKVYQTADNAVQMVKEEVIDAVNSMKN